MGGQPARALHGHSAAGVSGECWRGKPGVPEVPEPPPSCRTGLSFLTPCPRCPSRAETGLPRTLGQMELLGGEHLDFILLCAVWAGPSPHIPVEPTPPRTAWAWQGEHAHLGTGVLAWAGVAGAASRAPAFPGAGKPRCATLLGLMHGLPILHFFNKRNCNILGRLQAASGVLPLFPCQVPPCACMCVRTREHLHMYV